MWIVIYVAQTKVMADKIKDILQNSGLLVKVRALNQTSENNFGCYEILVPDSEKDEAHSILIDKIL